MTTNANGSQEPSYLPALVVLTSLFFMWGFITSLNDILIPHLKAIFTLSYVQAMLIQFSFFGAYFVMSVPSGYLVEKLGYRRGIIIGLSTAGVACLGFYPAASLQSYPLFLAALFVLASGITLLQVAANPYVAILGPAQTAASRLNLTQAFNSLGTTIGPLLGSMFILAAAVSAATPVDTAKEIETVQTPYLILAGLLFAIAIVFSQFKLPVVKGTDATTAAADDHDVPQRLETFAPGARRRRHLHVCRRGSRDRQLPGELHVAARSGRPAGERRGPLSGAVLGRRHGRVDSSARWCCAK